MWIFNGCSCSLSCHLHKCIFNGVLSLFESLNPANRRRRRKWTQKWAAYLTFWLIWPLKVISHMTLTYMWNRNRSRKWQRIKPAVGIWWLWMEMFTMHTRIPPRTHTNTLMHTYAHTSCMYESIIFKSSQIYILMNFKMRTLSWKSFFQGHQRKFSQTFREKKHWYVFMHELCVCACVYPIIKTKSSSHRKYTHPLNGMVQIRCSPSGWVRGTSVHLYIDVCGVCVCRSSKMFDIHP